MRANKIGAAHILAPMPGPWGLAITRLRLATPGLTKKAVAKRAKMTATTYGRIEKGQHTHTRKLQHIADVFSVGIEAVLMPDVPDPSRITVRQVVQQLVREAQNDSSLAAKPTITQTTNVLGQLAEEEERERARTKVSKKRSGRKR